MLLISSCTQTVPEPASPEEQMCGKPPFHRWGHGSLGDLPKVKVMELTGELGIVGFQFGRLAFRSRYPVDPVAQPSHKLCTPGAPISLTLCRPCTPSC